MGSAAIGQAGQPKESTALIETGLGARGSGLGARGLGLGDSGLEELGASAVGARGLGASNGMAD